MCGRAYEPRFLFAWPSSKMAVMGPQQLAGVLSIVARESAEATGRRVRRGGRRACSASRSRSRSSGSRTPSSTSGKIYDDGVIDPRDTRTVLGIALSAVHSQRRRGPPRLRRLPDVSGWRPMHRHAARRQPRRDRRAASCAPRATIGHRHRRGVLRRRRATLPFVARRPTRRCDCPGHAAADTYLARRPHRRRRAANRCRRGPPRATASSPSSAAFARAVRRGGPGLRRPPAGRDRGDGLEARGEGADGGGRRAGAPGRHGRAGDDADDGRGRTTGFPVIVKACVRRRRARHARRARSPDARRRGRIGRSGRPRPRSVTARCSSSGSSRRRVTSRCRSSPTSTAPSATCSSASARSSVATRRSSRRRRAPAVDDVRRAELCEAAVAAAKAIGYVSAGTVEFVLDAGRQLLVPRGEHPAPGRAPGHRDGHRPRPRRAPARGRAG